MPTPISPRGYPSPPDERESASSTAAGLSAVVDRAAGPELSIIVPTFNERDNVRPLVDELSRTLSDIDWEVVFVDDDSQDQTARIVRQQGAADRRVRCVHRIGRRGLSSACIEGILASSAPFVAIMDGDLQHDPAILPRMLDALKTSDVEIVVGSRYVAGGGVGGWNRSRALLSRLATVLGRPFVSCDLRDPMSGYFMMRRALFDQVVRDLSGLGFKILLDIFASARRRLAFAEIPFEFRVRQHGASKLDSQVIWEYLLLLTDKAIGRYVPVRFVMFTLVGGIGIVVHLVVLTSLYRIVQFDFIASQAAATLAAMAFNYSLNNVLTYRDRRRRGWRWLTGLCSFTAACTIGALANVGIAAYLFNRQSEWLFAAMAGVLAGAVWNYAVTNAYTWSGRK